MISIRIAEPVDYPACDQFIEQHPEATPYHFTAWLKSIEQAYQHQCFYLIAEKNGGIVGLVPLVKINLLFLPGSLCSLPFCDVGGILANSAEVNKALVTAAKDLSGKETAYNLVLRGSVAKDSVTKGKNTDVEKEFPLGSKVRMILPLPESSEVLLASFKPKLRSQVKKAAKNGVTYSQTSDLEAVTEFYKIMQFNMQRLGSPIHAKQWFESIVTLYGERAQIGLVHYQNKVVGGAIILLCGKTVTVPWASTLIEYNKYSTNMALYWGLLSFAADNQFESFDFGRSTIGEGTYRFKKQWGAKPVALDWQDFNINGLIEKTAKSSTFSKVIPMSKLKPMIISLWSKLPPAIANTLGPMFRRYISL